jgi:hypothetical protein
MPLTVTVQKGHDFSSGNVTRAALNSGAVPTVAITGAVDTTELSALAVTNAKVGTNADISLSKISGQAEDSILLVGSSASTGAGAKTIKALAGSGGALIKEVDNKAEITPSDDTIIASKLLKTEDTNVVFALGLLDDVAVDDYVMVHDTSVTDEGLVRLKKAKVSSIQKVGTTEYEASTVTGTTVGAITPFVIDLDGSPFQTIQLQATSAAHTNSFTVTHPPTGDKVKVVSVRVIGASGSGVVAPTISFTTGWNWLEMVSNGAPTTQTLGEDALLTLTVYGAAATDVYAAYAVTK